MRITSIDLQCYDYLWFAIDVNGCIIAFTSGGFGDVPEYVCRSKNETKKLEDYFMSLPNDFSSAKLLINNDGSQMAIYAEELARKGIFYYDACSDIEYEYGYSKISFPDKALHLADLPSNIQKIMSDHVVDVDVSTVDRIIVKNAYWTIDNSNLFNYALYSSNYDLCGYNRIPDIVSPDDDIDIDEGEVNYEEAIDDDD